MMNLCMFKITLDGSCCDMQIVKGSYAYSWARCEAHTGLPGLLLLGHVAFKCGLAHDTLQGEYVLALILFE